MPNYTAGKLYRISAYYWDTVELYTKDGVEIESGSVGRKQLASLPVGKSVFLFLGFVKDEGDNTSPLLHVIVDDMIGVIDARAMLSEFVPSEESDLC